MVARGKLLNDVLHLLEFGVDIQHHVHFDRLIDQHLEFLDRVLERRHVITKLAHPRESELLAALLDLSQGLIDEERVYHSGAQKTALVLFDIARHLAVPGNELRGCLGLLTAHRVDDAALDTGAVQVADELLERPGYRMPLPDFAGFGRAVQVRHRTWHTAAGPCSGDGGDSRLVYLKLWAPALRVPWLEPPGRTGLPAQTLREI